MNGTNIKWVKSAFLIHNNTDDVAHTYALGGDLELSKREKLLQMYCIMVHLVLTIFLFAFVCTYIDVHARAQRRVRSKSKTDRTTGLKNNTITTMCCVYKKSLFTTETNKTI